MAKGNVKWFNAAKGYGFIQPAGGDEMCSCTFLLTRGPQFVERGAKPIEFEVVENRGKSSAENLKISR